MLDLKEGIFSFNQLWTMLEDGLAMLLNSIIPEKQYGLAIYFAPHGAEIRLAVLDAVIKQFFKDEPHEKDALEAWAQLLKRLTTTRSSRNKIAHGTVQTPTIHGKLYARISGPMFELEKHKGDYQRPTGMSINELRAALNLCSRCLGGVHSLSLLIQETRYKGYDEPTLKRISRELADHLKTDSQDMYVLKPSILVNQPPPSQG